MADAFATALADELDAARLMIEDLAVRLCLDPIVFERHPGPLQDFDRAAQVIGEVAAALRHGGSPAQAAAAVRLDTVRSRLTEACEP